ncbi:MAG: HTH-type transcriptional repressor CytR [candidate division BRC1 bacterium ADurb.BinA364]|nr:MAG: HTH-type transcriptional repressor CytR [candidate division BRC1 bacterium ADurb.BinA364]
MRGTYLDFIRRERPGFEPLFCQRASDIRAAELRARGVTGLFCCDDVGAIQAIGRLREQGADVPDDFSVVSYGNTDLSRFFTPAITSVDPRNEEMADALAALIAPQGRLAAVDLRAHVALPELVIRAT